MPIPEVKKKSMLEKLAFVYGEDKADAILEQLETIIADHMAAYRAGVAKPHFDQTDVVVITYGDQIKEEGKPPLQSLNAFMAEHLKDAVSAVHILPFYPYTSDDGFSVVDYYQINPELGTWEDIQSFSANFELMFDAVINHISSKSPWFQRYLQGDAAYRNYFIEADPNADYSSVTRPRALPLLTEFDTAYGKKHLWTTFSDDQIDLNYANEQVFLEIAKLLLFYTRKGARLLRFDAIGYIWKRLGESCIHLPEAHKIVQLFRDILDVASPGTIVITETNVPHKDNISYFGNGHNEAHMVYQFPLPPLTLHTMATGNVRKLASWASSLEPISKETAFFNFLASHDGIGVVPAKGILSDEEINYLVELVQRRGGFVSYKHNGDGTQSPYELNINYFDALSDADDDEDRKVSRFLAAQTILLSLAGVPGIYVHSLLGSRSDLKGVEATGRYRSINRENCSGKPSKRRYAIRHPCAAKSSAVTSGFCSCGVRKRRFTRTAGNRCLTSAIRSSGWFAHRPTVWKPFMS
ncbi:sucrose phosphorylase [Paenibacillus cisolokensis]|uniref:Sucrose phosphorylase n=1 Tax=Paenibacillus cisolokensis TaxID=1658519 RepID=A0ABQ4N0B2_9BACL|nr:sugar phosphorylase [Paenibacillus cisolokensis]GIQ61615.1 sucrose phosphorylase [Paenibacillus cisolokensis]